MITGPNRYLVRDVSRHGKERFYVRVPGVRRKIRIRGQYDTPAFWQAYGRAVAELLAERAAPGPKKRKGNFDWLLTEYYESPAFNELEASTQRRRQAQLKEIAAIEITADGERMPIAQAHPSKHITPLLIKQLRDRWHKAGPYVATNRLKALRHLYKWAFERELVERDPARDVKLIKPKTGGWHSWSIEEVEQFIARWPIGTAPYVAMAVLLGTGGRRGDAYALGPENVYSIEAGGEAEEWIRFTPTKTRKTSGVVVDIPMVGFLREALDAGPTGDDRFIVGIRGGPFGSAASFGNEFKLWCKLAGLPHCSAHGLRKAGAVLLAERSGATPNQLLAIYGWTTLQQAELYTRAAERRKLSAVLSTLKLRQAKEAESVPPFEGGVPPARKP